MLRLLVLFAAMAAFSKQLMKQNIFRVLLGLAIAAVALLKAENLSRVRKSGDTRDSCSGSTGKKS